MERFQVTVRSAARSASANEDAAEDLAQSIWAELHGLRVREDGRPASKLAYYSGRGSLAGWLRAVVAQLSVDSFRKQRYAMPWLHAQGEQVKNQMFERFGLFGVPAAILVDNKGVVVATNEELRGSGLMKVLGKFLD